MATEPSQAISNRPRPWLVALLLITATGYVVMRIFSGPTAAPGVPTTPGRTQGRVAANGHVEPKDLDVRVETLTQQPAPLESPKRNIFRFEPKAPPPPPPGSFSSPKPVPADPVVPPPTPYVPPGPPPIRDTVKFIGVVETARGKIGAFSIWDPVARECRGVPSAAREGEVIDGRYRVVRLGIESATLTYLDGKGQDTLPLNGQACVVK
jgi:hypothetical protein